MREWLFGSDSLWSIMANGASSLAGLVLLYVGLVRFSRKFRAFLLLQPLHRRRGIAVERDMARTLRQRLRDVIEGKDHTAGAIVADIVRLRPEHLSPWDPEVDTFRRWLDKTYRPGIASLAARVVAPDQAALLDRAVRDVRQLLHQFDHVRPVPAHVAGGAPERSSRLIASAISGAAVLADAGSTRGAAVDEVLVWHDSTYRDERVTWGQHAAHDPADQALEIDDTYRLGDYNGRLVELIAVSVAANGLDGQTSFVLETRETCYRATEPPSPYAAKRLSFERNDPRLPVFHRDGATAEWRRELPPASQERVCFMTSYVSLVTFAEAHHFPLVTGLPEKYAQPTVDVLVLCRRSSVTRNGADTLSATAGGVVELTVGTSRLDTSALGTPDLARGACRELGEELGVDPDGVEVDPVAIWVATVMGRGASPTRPTGQLVASALFLASTDLGVDGLWRARYRASQTRGAFEVSDLPLLAMAPGPDGLQAFIEAVFTWSPQLDQHGLLSCYYTGLRAYGPTAIDAFRTRFAEDPWWSTPWEGEAGGVRVCREGCQMTPADRDGVPVADAPAPKRFDES